MNVDKQKLEKMRHFYEMPNSLKATAKEFRHSVVVTRRLLKSAKAKIRSTGRPKVTA